MSLGLIQVALPPEIAAIVGQGYTTTTSKRNVIVPVGEARVTRRFSSSAITLTGGLTIMPGDGVFLTSRALNASAGYSYAGGKRLTFQTTAGYSRMTSAGQQTIAPYDGYYGGAGMTVCSPMLTWKRATTGADITSRTSPTKTRIESLWVWP